MDKVLQMPLQQMEDKFRVACQQVHKLNAWIEEIQVRYNRADRMGHKGDRYNIRIKLCVAEGVRNMYYEYASRLSDKLTILRAQTGRDIHMTQAWPLG